jgi:hypothetical protein
LQVVADVNGRQTRTSTSVIEHDGCCGYWSPHAHAGLCAFSLAEGDDASNAFPCGCINLDVDGNPKAGVA